jgi:hypothetical protein
VQDVQHRTWGSCLVSTSLVLVPELQGFHIPRTVTYEDTYTLRCIVR